MLYEVVLNIKVDPDTFYWESDPSDRTEIVDEMIRNALWDMSETRILSMEVAEI